MTLVTANRLGAVLMITLNLIDLFTDCVFYVLGRGGDFRTDISAFGFRLRMGVVRNSVGCVFGVAPGFLGVALHLIRSTRVCEFFISKSFTDRLLDLSLYFVKFS